jgi:hypothetical protein
MASEHIGSTARPQLRVDAGPAAQDLAHGHRQGTPVELGIGLGTKAPVALAMQIVRKDLSITSLAELEAAAILTVSLLRAFFDRRINPAAKVSYPWERPRPGEEA